MADGISPSPDLVERKLSLGRADKIGPMPDANQRMKETTGHSMEDYINAMGMMGGAGGLVNTAEEILPSLLGKLAGLFQKETPKPNPLGFDTRVPELVEAYGARETAKHLKFLEELGRPATKGQMNLPLGQ